MIIHIFNFYFLIGVVLSFVGLRYIIRSVCGLSKDEFRYNGMSTGVSHRPWKYILKKNPKIDDQIIKREKDQKRFRYFSGTIIIEINPILYQKKLISFIILGAILFISGSLLVYFFISHLIRLLHSDILNGCLTHWMQVPSNGFQENSG